MTTMVAPRSHWGGGSEDHYANQWRGRSAVVEKAGYTRQLGGDVQCKTENVDVQLDRAGTLRRSVR